MAFNFDDMDIAMFDETPYQEADTGMCPQCGKPTDKCECTAPEMEAACKKCPKCGKAANKCECTKPETEAAEETCEKCGKSVTDCKCECGDTANMEVQEFDTSDFETADDSDDIVEEAATVTASVKSITNSIEDINNELNDIIALEEFCKKAAKMFGGKSDITDDFTNLVSEYSGKITSAEFKPAMKAFKQLDVDRAMAGREGWVKVFTDFANFYAGLKPEAAQKSFAASADKLGACVTECADITQEGKVDLWTPDKKPGQVKGSAWTAADEISDSANMKQQVRLLQKRIDECTTKLDEERKKVDDLRRVQVEEKSKIVEKIVGVFIDGTEKKTEKLLMKLRTLTDQKNELKHILKDKGININESASFDVDDFDDSEFVQEASAETASKVAKAQGDVKKTASEIENDCSELYEDLNKLMEELKSEPNAEKEILKAAKSNPKAMADSLKTIEKMSKPGSIIKEYAVMEADSKAAESDHLLSNSHKTEQKIQKLESELNRLYVILTRLTDVTRGYTDSPESTNTVVRKLTKTSLNAVLRKIKKIENKIDKLKGQLAVTNSTIKEAYELYDFDDSEFVQESVFNKPDSERFCNNLDKVMSNMIKRKNCLPKDVDAAIKFFNEEGKNTKVDKLLNSIESDKGVIDNYTKEKFYKITTSADRYTYMQMETTARMCMLFLKTEQQIIATYGKAVHDGNVSDMGIRRYLNAYDTAIESFKKANITMTKSFDYLKNIATDTRVVMVDGKKQLAMECYDVEGIEELFDEFFAQEYSNYDDIDLDDPKMEAKFKSDVMNVIKNAPDQIEAYKRALKEHPEMTSNKKAIETLEKLLEGAREICKYKGWSCVTQEGYELSEEELVTEFGHSHQNDHVVTASSEDLDLGKFRRNENRNVESVKIEDGVKEITPGAFEGCKLLRSVTIPGSVKRISTYAFCGCKSLTSISIPDSVTEIEHNAFDECTSLKAVTIPKGVTKIEERTFSGCTSLKSVVIPEGVTKIEKYAFAFCESLTDITIPSTVTEIGKYAFANCESLESVILPKGVKLGEYAFPKTTSIEYR